MVLTLTGSALHTDAGLHPIRSLLEQRCGISRLTPPGERLRLLEAELMARGRGHGNHGAVVGAGAGHRARTRIRACCLRGTQALSTDRTSSAELSAVLYWRKPGHGGGRGCALVRPVHHRDSWVTAGCRRRPAARGGDGTPRPVAARPLAGEGDRPRPIDGGRDRNSDRRPGSHSVGTGSGGGRRPLRWGAVLHRTGRRRAHGDRGAGGSLRALARPTAGERQRGTGCGSGGAHRPPVSPPPSPLPPPHPPPHPPLPLRVRFADWSSSPKSASRRESSRGDDRRDRGSDLELPPPGRNPWSCRTMAAATGVSKSTVQQVWSARGSNHIGSRRSSCPTIRSSRTSSSMSWGCI